MRRLMSVFAAVLMFGGCGEGSMDSKLSISPNENTPSDRTDLFLSDNDIQVVSMQAWMDYMPSVGMGSAPVSRLQVRFNADSQGCTTGDNFRIRLVQEGGSQILVIKRTKVDPCREVLFRTEINHAVEGAYLPGRPVTLNGEEIPVFESVIF